MASSGGPGGDVVYLESVPVQEGGPPSSGQRIVISGPGSSPKRVIVSRTEYPPLCPDRVTRRQVGGLRRCKPEPYSTASQLQSLEVVDVGARDGSGAWRTVGAIHCERSRWHALPTNQPRRRYAFPGVARQHYPLLYGHKGSLHSEHRRPGEARGPPTESRRRCAARKAHLARTLRLWEYS